ncbi:MAG: AEC family transporter [Caldiserica bacterium]|nr:AEC family transporter [Caldisericota bacterium]
MFGEVLIPIFLLVGLGYGAGKILRLDPKPFSTLAFWIFSPALIFESLRTASLSWNEMGVVAAFVSVHYLGVYLLSLPLGALLFRGDRDARAVASLVLTFGNCGNLGLPLLLFALGQRGMEIGAVFLAANTVLLATLGVAIASGEARASRAIGAIFRVPWLYAVAAALIARELPAFPLWLSRTTATLREGAIPFFLVLVGLQLAHIDPRRVLKGALGLAAGRLVLAGSLAWTIAILAGLKGTLRDALVLEGSVPSAVNSLILALEFDRRPDLAAAALFLSTVLSAGTLWLTLLGLSRGI